MLLCFFRSQKTMDLHMFRIEWNLQAPPSVLSELPQHPLWFVDILDPRCLQTCITNTKISETYQLHFHRLLNESPVLCFRQSRGTGQHVPRNSFRRKFNQTTPFAPIDPRANYSYGIWSCTSLYLRFTSQHLSSLPCSQAHQALTFCLKFSYLRSSFLHPSVPVVRHLSLQFHAGARNVSEEDRVSRLPFVMAAKYQHRHRLPKPQQRKQWRIEMSSKLSVRTPITQYYFRLITITFG